MKKFAVLAIAAMVAGSAFADSGLVNSYIQINGVWFACSGATGDWTSDVVLSGDATNPADLGTFISGDGNIKLGGQVQLWEYYEGQGNIDWQGGGTVDMYYSIDGGASKTTSLTYSSYDGSNNHFETGGATFAPIDVDVGGVGEHTIAIWFHEESKDIWDSNNGGNFNGKFTTAVPEPATMSLLGLGALAMVLRRKLSK